MDELTAYLQTIANACPDIRISSAKLLTAAGQFNDIVSLNDDLIFRFPHTPQVAESNTILVMLLTFLQGRLPLPIPCPLYTSEPYVRWQQCFIAYRRIPGVPLYRETLAAIHDLDAVRAMAAQLTSFLRTLHQLEPADLPTYLAVSDGVGQWETLYSGIQETLFTYMRVEARRCVVDLFDNYLKNPARFAFSPVLRHGDFGGSNILYDPLRNRINGVIDFDSLGLGDPATDVAALSTYGEQFFALCLVTYPEMQTMLDRALFYRSTFALQEAYYGLRDNDWPAFQRGIAEYV
jgi:aminoglycoside 2''-phosphotransferase